MAISYVSILNTFCCSLKGYAHLAFCTGHPECEPATGNKELSLFSSMGVLSTAKHICKTPDGKTPFNNRSDAASPVSWDTNQ